MQALASSTCAARVCPWRMPRGRVAPCPMSRVILDARQPAVGWLGAARAGRRDRPTLDRGREPDHEQFNAAVAKSNDYRKILYGWSLVLAIAIVWLDALRRLYAGLERPSPDRTADLAKALEALWGEMKLARKIQEALVPASPRLARCDVAVGMKPPRKSEATTTISCGWITRMDLDRRRLRSWRSRRAGHDDVPHGRFGGPARQTPTRPRRICSRRSTPCSTENHSAARRGQYMSITAFRRDPTGR